MTKNYYKKYKKYKAKYQGLKGGEVIHFENSNEFYNQLNNEKQPYVFLIGEGNDLVPDNIYTELQDDMDGTNPFVNSFINVHSQSRDLEDALKLFKGKIENDQIFGERLLLEKMLKYLIVYINC